MRSIFRYGFRVLFIVVGGYVVVTAYVTFIPPITTPAYPVTTRIQQVAAQDNAWTEYQTALAALDSQNSSTEAIIEALKKYATGLQDALGKTEKEYLDKHQSVLEHLQAGAKLPQAQLYARPVTLTTEHPSLLRVRALSALTTAEARRLAEQGKLQDAVNLDFMLLKMGTQMAETNSSLMPILIAVYCRGQALQSLTFLLGHNLHKNNISSEKAVEINLSVAHETANLNAHMPTPEQAFAWEWLAEERYVAALAQGQPPAPPANRFEKIFVNLPGGLRLRATEDFMQRHPALLAQFQPALASWNVQAANDTQARINKQSSEDGNSPWLPRLVSARVAQHVIPQVGSALQQLSGDKAASDALVSLAVVNAYRIAHGSDPMSLSAASDYAGLPAPTPQNP